MKKRLTEFLFVLAVAALVIQFTSKEEPEVKEPARTQTVQPAGRTLSIGESVPDFELTDATGKVVAYKKGDGPLFITLTATGCADCLRRIDAEDVTAYEMAKKSEFDVWNVLVYHPAAGAADFVKKRQPTADAVLADPQAVISVKTLGGSDSTCWLLIDEKGRLVYRGPADLPKLETALQAL